MDAAFDSQVLAQIADLYIDWCRAVDLRVDVLWAQMMLETDSLRFGGQVKPQQLNFAGLKTSDSTGFASFATVTAGVIAHVMHMAWYVYPDHILPECSITYDPRHLGPHRNNVRTVADLSGKWALNPDYARRIVSRWGG